MTEEKIYLICHSKTVILTVLVSRMVVLVSDKTILILILIKIK